MTLTVDVPPQLEAMIREKVETGHYASASAVVAEALRLMQERDAAAADRLEALRRNVAAGLADLDAGRTVDADIVFAELREIIDSKKVK